jgi:predicted transcriptional regulator
MSGGGSEREKQALTAFDGTDELFGYLSFKSIAKRSGLDIKHVRRTVRSLARKGLAEYGRGLWTEDGQVAGSGYCITDAGREALASRTDPEQRS